MAPLGRLYDIRQALPEGYHNPYVESRGDGEEHGEEEEGREGIDEDNENEEGNGVNQGEEIDKDEDGDACWSSSARP